MRKLYLISIISVIILGGCGNMFNSNSAEDVTKYLSYLKEVRKQYTFLIGKSKEDVLKHLGKPVSTAKDPNMSRMPGSPDEMWIYNGLERTNNLFRFFFKNNILIDID